MKYLPMTWLGILVRLGRYFVPPYETPLEAKASGVSFASLSSQERRRRRHIQRCLTTEMQRSMSGNVAVAQDSGLHLQLVQPVLDHVTDADQA